MHAHLINNGYKGEDFEVTGAYSRGDHTPPEDSFEAQLLAMEAQSAASPKLRGHRSSSLADTRRLLAATVWPDSSNR